MSTVDSGEIMDRTHRVRVAKLVNVDLDMTTCKLCDAPLKKEDSFKIETRYHDGQWRVVQKYYHASCFVNWILSLELTPSSDYFKGLLKGRELGLKIKEHKEYANKKENKDEEN